MNGRVEYQDIGVWLSESKESSVMVSHSEEHGSTGLNSDSTGMV